MAEGSLKREKGELGTRSLFDLLPERIVDVIFSKVHRLENKDAVQLSLVSKQFLNQLQNRKTLEFKSYAAGRKRNPNRLKKKKYKEELDYVRSTLKRYQNQNTNLETLSICFASPDHLVLPDYEAHDDDDALVVHECIELASKIRLANLNLYMSHDGYALSDVVFEFQSLEKLTLQYCWLYPKGPISLPNLRVLRLVCVFWVYHGVFKNLIKGCPLLETLIMDNCNWLKWFKLKLSNLPNLKILDVHLPFKGLTLQVCESAATSLKSIRFTYIPDKDDEVRFSDPPITSHLNLGKHEYPNLETLDLSRAPVHKNFFTNFGSRFPRLECLSIGPILGVRRRFNLSNPTLKEVCLNYSEGYPLEKACFDVPNIVCFKFTQLSEPHCRTWLPDLLFNGKSGLGGGRPSQIDLDCNGIQTTLIITFPVV